MPELPEIANLAHQLNSRLTGKTITRIEVLQPKCLNIDPADFTAALVGASFKKIRYHGKWIQAQTSQGWLLLNLGMGGELLIVSSDKLPEKHRLVFYLDDATCLSVNFWWFGYAHFTTLEGLDQHEMSARLGPNALDLDANVLHTLLKGRRGSIKSFLLDQANLAGIGNAYIHDILFFAQLHPLRKIETLTEDEITALWQGIQQGLRPSLDKGGAFYEQDTYGEKGGFTFAEIKVGYRAGQPCPTCGTTIKKIKTGSTTSFICPKCQV